MNKFKQFLSGPYYTVGEYLIICLISLVFYDFISAHEEYILSFMSGLKWTSFVGLGLIIMPLSSLFFQIISICGISMFRLIKRLLNR